MKRLNWILVVCLVLCLSLSLTSSSLFGCKKKVEEVAEVKPEAPERTPDEPIPPDEPPLPPPTDEDEIELKVIEEIALLPNTQDIVFDPKTGRPMIYIVGKEDRKPETILFLNNEGVVEKEYKIPKIPSAFKTNIVFSKNKKFIAVNSVIGDFDGEYILNKRCSFSILNNEGKVLWEMKNLKGIRSIIPSPNGQYAVGLPFWEEEPLYFIKANGEKSTISGLPTDSHPKIDFSEDGKYWVVNKGDSKAYLTVFSGSREELWRKRLDGLAMDVTISDDGEFIAAIAGSPSGQTKLLFLDNKNNLIWEQPVRFSGYLFEFSQDQRSIFVICRLNHLYMFNTTDGKKLWEHKAKGENFIFRGFSATPNLEMILVGGYSEGGPERTRDRDFLFLFDRDGKKLWQKEFEGYYITSEPIYPHELDLSISPDGRQIAIGTKGGILIFKNPFIE